MPAALLVLCLLLSELPLRGGSKKTKKAKKKKKLQQQLQQQQADAVTALSSAESFVEGLPDGCGGRAEHHRGRYHSLF